jgi:hypothetical protein
MDLAELVKERNGLVTIELIWVEKLSQNIGYRISADEDMLHDEIRLLHAKLLQDFQHLVLNHWRRAVIKQVEQPTETFLCHKVLMDYINFVERHFKQTLEVV